MRALVATCLYTNHAARGLQRLRLTVQLVSEAFDVIETIGNHDIVARQHPLHSGIFFCARIFLGFGSVVDAARHTKCLVVDEMHLQSASTSIGAGIGNLRLEVFFQLEGSGGLPGRGIPCAQSAHVAVAVADAEDAT